MAKEFKNPEGNGIIIAVASVYIWSTKIICMKWTSWLFVLPLTLLGSYSCQKSSGSGAQKSKTEMLAASTWKFDHAGLDLDNNGTIDSPVPAGVLKPCDTDGSLTFNTNGTGTGDEGPTKCDAANPQTVSFTWSLKNNETIINFSGVLFGGLTGDVKLLSVTDSQLTMEKDVTNGITVNVIVVLKH
jgi:hypothetical protein